MPYLLRLVRTTGRTWLRDGVGFGSPVREIFADRPTRFDTLPAVVIGDTNIIVEEVSDDEAPVAAADTPKPERKRGRPRKAPPPMMVGE